MIVEQIVCDSYPNSKYETVPHYYKQFESTSFSIDKRVYILFIDKSNLVLWDSLNHIVIDMSKPDMDPVKWVKGIIDGR